MNEQIDRLANFIMANVDGEPSQSEGAGDCAIRIITNLQEGIREAMNNLGVPNAGYPSPVAEAYKILEALPKNETP